MAKMEDDEDEMEFIEGGDEDDVEVIEDDGDEDEDTEDDEAIDEDEADESVHVFLGHTSPVFPVSCSPVDHSLVATGGMDDNVCIWRIGDETAPRKLTDHSNSIGSLSFSSSGQLLASGGVDGIVNVWDLSGTLKHRLEGPSDEIVWIDWHPRGHVILVGSCDFSAWMWNADTGVCLNVFTGHGGPVFCARFTPDGKFVCTVSKDGSMRLWNPVSGQCISVVEVSRGISSLIISKDSNLAIFGSEDGNVYLVNVRNGRILGTLSGHEGDVVSIALSPSLPLAATVGKADDRLIIWDLQTLSARFVCEHEKGISKLIWSSKDVIYTSCFDGKVRIWDPRSGGCLRTLHGHKKGITDISITRDEQFIVSVSDDKTARVFLIN